MHICGKTHTSHAYREERTAGSRQTQRSGQSGSHGDLGAQCVSNAECSEAGRYGCQLLDNDNPAGHEEDVTLLVNCESAFSGPLVLLLSVSACLAQSNFMQTATCLLRFGEMGAEEGGGGCGRGRGFAKD